MGLEKEGSLKGKLGSFPKIFGGLFALNVFGKILLGRLDLISVDNGFLGAPNFDLGLRIWGGKMGEVVGPQ